MFSVVITEKGGAQRRIDFDKTEVTIGRVQGNDIILPKGNVSKRHSRIVLKDGRFIVVDLKSTNGTYVNGRKITSPLVVKSGDKVYVGDFIITVEESAPGAIPVSGPVDMGQPAPGQPAPAGPMSAPPPTAAPPAPMAAPPMPMAAPQAAPAQSAFAPTSPVGERRPPPLRSAAPPPPRQPTLGGFAGGPPPMGQPPAVEREPLRSEPPAPRYPLEDEPGDDVGAPPPRAAATVRPAGRPEFGRASETPGREAPSRGAEPVQAPSDMPPARPAAASMRASAPEPAAAPAPITAPVAAAPVAAAPVAAALVAAVVAAAPVAAAPVAAAPVAAAPVAPAGRVRRPRPRDVRDPLAYVVASLAESADASSFSPPETVESSRWSVVRESIDDAIARLRQEGGHVEDHESLAQAALHEVLGLGALASLLDDPQVIEIVVDGPSRLSVDRGAGLSPVAGRFSSSEQLITILGRLVSRGGGDFDAAASLVEATLPDGAHLFAVLPPVSLAGPVVEIRRAGRPPVHGESLVQQGMLTTEMLGLLRAAVDAGRNVAIVGPSDLVGPVVSMVSNLGAPDDRVLSLEASPELALASEFSTRLVASADVGLGRLLSHASRLRADRVVVDGVRGGEAREALVLLASRGGGCVLGVRSAADGSAVEHLEALASLGGGSDARLLCAAVHVAVKVARDASGLRRILSISEVSLSDGMSSESVLFEHDGEFRATGATPSF